MANDVRFEGVTPYLRYENAGAAIDWLVRTLGFEERSRYVDKDGVVRQAELYAGATEVWLSGHDASYWETHPRVTDQFIMVWVDDVDAQYERAKSAGASASPPVDQTWGVRNFHVTDPGGYHWGFCKRLPAGYQQVKPLEDGGLREEMKQEQPSAR